MMYSQVVFSQNATFKNNKEFRDSTKLKAKIDINKLSSGTLLVRLNSKSEQISYYRKYNKLKEADKIEKRQQAFNQEMINSFRKSFTFCKVQFFCDTFSRKIVEGKLNEVVFYSDSLILDPLIKIEDGNYYIAELGRTEGDNSRFRHDYIVSPANEGAERRTRMFGEENLNIAGFVIRDKNFVMLHEPFPYYVKIPDTYPPGWKMRGRLKDWNKKLIAFNNL